MLIHDLLGSRGLGYSTSPMLAHPACLRGSKWLYSVPAASLGVHSKVCHLQLTGVSIATEAALSPMFSPALTQRQASAALHCPFMLSKPVPSGRLLHMTRFCFQFEMQSWSSTGPQLVCVDPKEIIHRRFCLHNAGLLLVTADFSASQPETADS